MKPNNIYIYLYYYYFNNFFGCIALGWLCIVMLLHKEIERLKINTYSLLPHSQLARVIPMRAFACNGSTTW